jgi:oligopeptidase B
VNLEDGSKTVIDKDPIPPGFNPDDYTVERKKIPSARGGEIPVYLMYRKGDVPLEDRPGVLEAYGAYDTIMFEPEFVHERLSLLDRGVVYAFAHVRGGGELGRDWYLNGKLANKQNTFSDFIECSEYLQNNGIVEKGRLAACGLSAGGLMMGVISNQRPDAFKAVVAEVPFVDAITTMLDPKISLTTTEYEEWGNPKDMLSYRTLAAYSPYDNVKAQEYPAMLVTAGFHDVRVHYWEPAKWVAKLRDTKIDDNTLILHTNMAAGHSGSSGRYDEYRETALKYAFLLRELGVEN